MKLFSRITSIITDMIGDSDSRKSTNKDIKEIKGLIKDMGKKQQEFDAKITEAGVLIGTLVRTINELKSSVEAETAQIEQFVANMPQDLNTNSLNDVVEHLKQVVESTQGIDARVAGIFSTAPEAQTAMDEATEGNSTVETASGADAMTGEGGELSDDSVPPEAEDMPADPMAGAVEGGPEAGNTMVPETTTPSGEVTFESPDSGADAERTAGGDNGTVANSEGDGTGGTGSGPIGGTGGGGTGSGGGTTGTTGS